MKSTQISILIASLILGISFIIGCSLINNNMVSEQKRALAVETVDKATINSDKPLISIAETAVFLNMKEDQVMNIIKAEYEVLSVAGSFQGTMFPYIKIDNQYFISRDELLNWIKEASIDKRKYINGQY